MKIGRTILITFLLLLCSTHAFAYGHAPRGHKKIRIAIFNEEGFPSAGTPAQLSPGWFYDTLVGCYSPVYVDCQQLADTAYFTTGNFDVLILPYGETFPHEAFPSLKQFLYSGGNLLHAAGRPFWQPMEMREGKWQALPATNPYDEFMAPLGIKYYELENDDAVGISITTSVGVFPVMPTKGNVFPYRIPCRDFYSVASLLGRDISDHAIVTKSWNNAYGTDPKGTMGKWCLIGARGENHPFNPKSSDAQNNLMRIMRYLSYPVVLFDLKTSFAAYHQNERVEISLNAVNYGNSREQFVVYTEVRDKKGVAVFRHRRAVNLSAHQQVTLAETWYPRVFNSDFYVVEARLEKDGTMLDYEKNGFVVMQGDVLHGGPVLETKGTRFFINGAASFIFGVNYYDSKLGELMWLKPNVLRLRDDFRTMRELGVNYVRIHYHHPKWFRDYFKDVLKQDIDPFLTEADTSVMPSERSWRTLDAIIYLAQEQGLIFSMDIFSLVPQEMGDPVGWLGMQERMYDTQRVAKQLEFIALLANRYRDVPGITWDLWNEPRLEKGSADALAEWAGTIINGLRRNGDNHPVTIGDDMSMDLLDIVDYASVHTEDPSLFIGLKNLPKPFLFQETWNPAGCSLEEEKRQAEELRKDFYAFTQTQAAGFVPWQWTRQSRLWNNSSESERWDDELGICVHDDGTVKIAGKMYNSLIRGMMTE